MRTEGEHIRSYHLKNFNSSNFSKINIGLNAGFLLRLVHNRMTQ